MKILILLAAFIATNSYAVGYKIVSKNYTLYSNSGFRTIYYNCDSVERKVERLLEKMGAQNIRVRCSGGLDTFGNFPATPARVRTRFDVLSSNIVNNGTRFSNQRVEIRERRNCNLYNSSFSALAPLFEISNVSVTRCSRLSRVDRTRISFNVLKE